MTEQGTESLPFEETAGTGITPGNGSAESMAAESGSDTQVADSLEQGHEGGDYESRLREGGDFAVDAAKDWQRKFGKANSRAEKLEEERNTLQPLLDAAQGAGGAQNVVDQLRLLHTIASDPFMSQALQRYQQTGTFDAPQAEAEGEYVDPLEKELADLKRLVKTQSDQLQGYGLKQESNAARQQIAGHFEKVLGSYQFTAEERGQVERGVESTLKSWETTEGGVQALNSLNEDTVRNLVRSQFSDDELAAIYRRNEQSRREEKGRLATDAPSSTATGQAHSAAKTPLEAFRIACKRESIDPRNFRGVS